MILSKEEQDAINSILNETEEEDDGIEVYSAELPSRYQENIFSDEKE